MDVDTMAIETLRRTIDRFWETIPPVWNRVRGNVRSIATEKFDISVEQFHILRHIRKGVASVSELASIRQISRPAVSQAVNVLVEMGYISRQQSTEDRRYVELELTPQGDTLLNAIFEQNRAWMLEKLSALTPDELHCLERGMEILKQTFEDREE